MKKYVIVIVACSILAFYVIKNCYANTIREVNAKLDQLSGQYISFEKVYIFASPKSMEGNYCCLKLRDDSNEIITCFVLKETAALDTLIAIDNETPISVSGKVVKFGSTGWYFTIDLVFKLTGTTAECSHCPLHCKPCENCARLNQLLRNASDRKYPDCVDVVINGNSRPLSFDRETQMVLLDQKGHQILDENKSMITCTVRVKRSFEEDFVQAKKKAMWVIYEKIQDIFLDTTISDDEIKAFVR